MRKEDFQLIIGGKGRTPESDYKETEKRMKRGESSVEETLEAIFKNSDRLNPETALLWGCSLVTYAHERLRQAEGLYTSLQEQSEASFQGTVAFFQEALGRSAVGDNSGVKVIIDGLSNYFLLEGRGRQFSGLDGYLDYYEKAVLLSNVSYAIPNGVPFVIPRVT